MLRLELQQPEVSLWSFLGFCSIPNPSAIARRGRLLSAAAGTDVPTGWSLLPGRCLSIGRPPFV